MMEEMESKKENEKKSHEIFNLFVFRSASYEGMVHVCAFQFRVEKQTKCKMFDLDFR